MLPMLVGAGAFTVLLGLLHFFLPALLDFRGAIPEGGAPLRPFHLLGCRYPTKRSDVRGLVWVMNHAVSYTLVTIGVVDLAAVRWIGTWLGVLVAAWIAGWWFLRAGCQLCLGHRRGDLVVLAWFAALGLLHVGAALA